MRRLTVALSLVVLALFSTGAMAPATHAQTVPAISASPTTVAIGGTTTVTGTGFTPNNWAYVYWQRPDGTTNAVYDSTSSTGTFAQTLGFAASHGTGNEYISAYDYGTGRWTNQIVVTDTMNTPPPPTTMYLTVVPNPVPAGYVSVVTGYNFTPNNNVYAYWQRPNGTTNGIWLTTNPNGSFTFNLGFLPQNGCGTEIVWAYDNATARWSPGFSVSVGC